jgi:hypothetical protein
MNAREKLSNRRLAGRSCAIAKVVPARPSVLRWI